LHVRQDDHRSDSTYDKTIIEVLLRRKMTASVLEQLVLYLRTCTLAWLGLYITANFILFNLSGGSLMLHVSGVGGLLCLISYFRLPPPDPATALKILGQDPRNFDGSPSKKLATRTWA
jgi:hypothetical protein